MPQPSRVAIGLGANLGQPRQQLAAALDQLAAAGLANGRQSSLYETQPVDCVPGTPLFFNAAVVGTWPGSPLDLLLACQRIEQRLGRPLWHSSREARRADLDLLLVDQLQLHSRQLTLPHPRLRQRLFVLAPLAEIAPDWPVPPDGVTVAELCQRLRQAEPGQAQIRRLA